jgi:N-acetyl-1-D-myo-inositol-2-amino-2-deoxy-alpha-D-glucopyranoside deacetylase
MSNILEGVPSKGNALETGLTRMSELERVLFVHAHPDDETISTGGTLATLVTRGASVTVVTCTRGERGEVIPSDLQYALSSAETLSALREMELRRAMAVLGVTDHRFLGETGARWSAREPRRYVDSGMQWGSDGAEAVADPGAESFTAAEFGDIAADIAAVIIDVSPDAVISYDVGGGYGHPDHVLAAQAARRAAEVYGVPFFAIEPEGATGTPTLQIDVDPVFEVKKRALEAYRSQLVVNADTFSLSNGSAHPIARVEAFRRIIPEGTRSPRFAAQTVGSKIVNSGIGLLIGLAAGALLTVYHQSTVTIGKTPVPLGLIAAIVLTAALLLGFRLAYGTRIVAAFAAVGMIAIVGILSLKSTGGSVLVPGNPVGYIWSLAPTVIALIVLAWPHIQRRPASQRPAGKLAVQDVSKGPTHQ